MYRIIGNDGKEYGPVSIEQLRQWISEGRATATSRVRAEAGGEWKLLSQFPEFAGLLPAAAPPPFAAGQMHPGTPPRTSGMAIASLVLGILGPFSCGITSIVGLILGIAALLGINKSQGRVSGSGLAIAGICVSGVFLLLAPGLLLPAFARAREKAMSVSCLNNLRQVALGARIYATANDNRLPPASNWSAAIQLNGVPPRLFTCPTDQAGSCSYAINRSLSGRKVSELNPQTVLLFESNLGWNGAGGLADVAFHGHTGTGSSPRREQAIAIAHVDGSVEVVPRSRLNSLRWNP